MDNCLEKEINQNNLIKGDESVFNLIFHRYYALLCAVAFQYIPDRQICESLSEDVLFTLWDKREDILPLSSIKAYLMKCVHNKAIDYLRSQENKIYEDIDDPVHCFIPEDELFEKFVATELEKRVNEEIESLPENSRKVFCLSRFENKSYGEIAEILGISVNTVKYHIKSSLNTLRQNLSDYMSVIILLLLSATK
jgi:RNA polymerase sigma-70 factor (ECF subfamily)